MSQTIHLDTLHSSVFFTDVSDTVLESVLPHCEIMTLATGDILFEQDSQADALYFLESGKIQVIRRYPEGYEVVIATEEPPYIIGEISMLAGQVRTGRVVAIENCRLIKISQKAILELCESASEIPLQALKNLGIRLYRLNLRVRENAISNVSARVASLLLLMANNETSSFKNTSATINDMARAAATNSDIVNRLLKQWAEYEIISLSEQEISIKQAEALRNLAG